MLTIADSCVTNLTRHSASDCASIQLSLELSCPGDRPRPTQHRELNRYAKNAYPNSDDSGVLSSVRENVKRLNSRERTNYSSLHICVIFDVCWRRLSSFCAVIDSKSSLCLWLSLSGLIAFSIGCSSFLFLGKLS